jgi:hypothetical protein
MISLKPYRNEKNVSTWSMRKRVGATMLHKVASVVRLKIQQRGRCFGSWCAFKKKNMLRKFWL